MKKILLISNHVFHYRIRVYNYFTEAFRKEGYELSVISGSIQKSVVEPIFEVNILRGSFLAYTKYIKKHKPDYIINFLHLKNFRQIPIMHLARNMGIPVIWWNHGINLKTPDAKIKNYLFHIIHSRADAIVLYSKNEKVFIREKNHGKTFIANNTLNLEDLNYDRNYEADLKSIQQKYKISSNKIILFVGRITPNKELGVLLNQFQNSDVQVVLVGPGISKELKQLVEINVNYHYLGAIYDREELSALFNASALFCIPGNLGLALIEALYWGKPTITMNGLNSPEIIYLKNGENGFIVNSGEELRAKALKLLNDKALYKNFSENARETFINEAHISRMFKGFLDAIKYCD